MTLIKIDVTGVPNPELDRYRRTLRARRDIKRRRAEHPLPKEQERFRLFSAEDLDAVEPVEWLIEGYLAAGELSVLWGPGDSYKSFVALHWAASVSRHSPVVYIAAEGASGLPARVMAWRKHHGVNRLPGLHFMPAHVNVHRGDDLKNWVAAMTTQLATRGPALVVVDTLARNFVGGSENDAKDLGEFVDGCEHIRKQLGTAVLVIHHATKNADRERGGESLRNASFAMFKAKRINKTTTTLTCDRMKDAAPPAPLQITPHHVVLDELGPGMSSLAVAWPVPARQGHGPKALKEPKLSGRQTRLLRLLNEPEGEPKRSDLARRLRTSESTIRRELQTLLESGFAVGQGSSRDRRYVLTDRGRNAL